ncbi:MAG: hypothetical protein WD766_00475 [Gemmatimonadota bacterium]
MKKAEQIEDHPSFLDLTLRNPLDRDDADLDRPTARRNIQEGLLIVSAAERDPRGDRVRFGDLMFNGEPQLAECVAPPLHGLQESVAPRRAHLARQMNLKTGSQNFFQGGLIVRRKCLEEAADDQFVLPNHHNSSFAARCRSCDPQ